VAADVKQHRQRNMRCRHLLETKEKRGVAIAKRAGKNKLLHAFFKMHFSPSCLCIERTHSFVLVIRAAGSFRESLRSS
jgi:hypothetical protein